MVIIELLECVKRAVCLDTSLNLTELGCSGSRIYINSHKLIFILFLCDRELVLHFRKLTVGLCCVGVLGSIVSAYLDVIEGFLSFFYCDSLVFSDCLSDNAEDQSFHSFLFYKSGNEVLCFLTTYRILNTKTVFNVLNIDLTVHCSLFKAVEVFCVAVIEVLYRDLRHKLISGCIRVCGRAGCDVNGVGEENLTCCNVYCCYFSGEFICPKLITVFFIFEGHCFELIFTT